MQETGSKTRICLVIHSLRGGGMERVMSLLANNFSERENVEVHIVLIGIHRKVGYKLNDAVRVHRPPFIFKNARRLYDTGRTMLFLRNAVKSIDPVTVLSFGEMWNNMVLLSLIGSSYPVYVSDRSQPEKDLGWFHNTLRRLLYPKAKGYIAQTHEARRICEERGWNENVCVIGNPIRDIKPDPSVIKENIILTVGRLIETKHIDHLIDIFSRINPPDWKLVIVGGDVKGAKLSAQMDEKIRHLKMENKISLEGQQDSDEYFNKSKLFAFASSSEGFPNVIGEALSAGLPVISYDCVAGPSEMINEGQNGYLVPLFDKQIFEEKLRELIVNETKRKTMAINAKESISQFSAESISGDFLRFITEVNKDI